MNKFKDKSQTLKQSEHHYAESKTFSIIMYLMKKSKKLNIAQIASNKDLLSTLRSPVDEVVYNLNGCICNLKNICTLLFNKTKKQREN